jgi:hypothetical protein
VILLCYIGIWLHVSTTSGHPQAVKICEIYITIAIPIMGGQTEISNFVGKKYRGFMSFYVILMLN